MKQTHSIQNQSLEVAERQRQRSDIEIDGFSSLERNGDGRELDGRHAKHQSEMFDLPELGKTTLNGVERGNVKEEGMAG